MGLTENQARRDAFPSIRKLTHWVKQMPTITKFNGNASALRASIEREIENLDLRIQADRGQIEATIDNASSQGRQSLTESEDVKCESLFRSIGAAKADRSRKAAALAEAIKLESDENEYARQSQISIPTNAGRPASGADRSYNLGSRTEFSASGGRVTAHQAYGAGGSYEVAREHAERTAERDKHITGGYGSFGAQLRALSTTTASAIVPTLWSFPIIDKARNNAVAFKAGATLVPMQSKVTQVGRLTVDPVASYRTEGSAVTATDPTFDFIQLTATTLSALTVFSMEFLQDAPDADSVVENAIAASMGVHSRGLSATVTISDK